MSRLLLLLILLLPSNSLLSQTWNGEMKVLTNNRGEIVDQARVVEWPRLTPSYLHGQFNYRFVLETRLHNGRIDLRYMKDHKSHTTMTQKERLFWRANFAVYRSDSDDFTSAELYTKGLGIGNVTFPVMKDGHYLVLILWGGNDGVNNEKNKGDGRMIYCKVEDQLVTVYDAMK